MERHPLIKVLDRAWRLGITVQSQFFREHPKLVALAASLGLITTLDPEGNYGGTWRVTPDGCYQLFNPQESQDESTRESEGVRTVSPLVASGNIESRFDTQELFATSASTDTSDGHGSLTSSGTKERGQD